MKVKDLIAELQKLDPELTVLVYDGCGDDGWGNFDLGPAATVEQIGLDLWHEPAVLINP